MLYRNTEIIPRGRSRTRILTFFSSCRHAIVRLSTPFYQRGWLLVETALEKMGTHGLHSVTSNSLSGT